MVRCVLLCLLLTLPVTQLETAFKRSCLNLHRHSTYLSGVCIVLHEGNEKNRTDADTQCSTDYTDGHLASIYNQAQIDKIADILDLTIPAWCDLRRDPNDINAWLHSSDDSEVDVKAKDPPWDSAITNNPSSVGNGVVVTQSGVSNRREELLNHFLCQFAEPASRSTEFYKRQHGYRASNSDTINQWTVAGSIVCAESCAELSGCRSLAFSPTTKECHLYPLASEALTLTSDTDYELFDKVMKDTDCSATDPCRAEASHVLLIGGDVNEQNIEAYYPLDPTLNGVIATLSGDLRKSAVIEWYDGKVLIAGGKQSGSTVILSLATMMFSPASEMSVPRNGAASTTLHGAVVVCGGHNHLTPDPDVQETTCEKFVNYKWEMMPSFNQSRLHPSLVNLNNKLYLLGGWEPKVERFDPETNSWSYLNNFQSNKGTADATVFEGNMVTCGGWPDAQECNKYNEALDEWTPFASMLGEHRRFRLAPFNDRLYALGGLDSGTTVVDTAEFYSEATHNWTMATNLLQTRHHFGIVVV